MSSSAKLVRRRWTRCSRCCRFDSRHLPGRLIWGKGAGPFGQGTDRISRKFGGNCPPLATGLRGPPKSFNAFLPIKEAWNAFPPLSSYKLSSLVLMPHFPLGSAFGEKVPRVRGVCPEPRPILRHVAKERE